MDNIDKIRQEIERLKKCSQSAKMEWIDEGYNQNAFAEDCRMASFEHLLSFLDTLSEEPDNEDLDAEIENYFKGFYMDLTDQGYILKNSDGSVGLMSVKDIARHFYELGRLSNK